MNIPKLFETQRLLDSHINEKHPIKGEEDRLTKVFYSVDEVDLVQL